MLTLLQPRLNRRLAHRQDLERRGALLVPLAIYLVGVYGGYSAAALRAVIVVVGVSAIVRLLA